MIKCNICISINSKRPKNCNFTCLDAAAPSRQCLSVSVMDVRHVLRMEYAMSLMRRRHRRMVCKGIAIGCERWC
jgi:hypothetical protein